MNVAFQALAAGLVLALLPPHARAADPIETDLPGVDASALTAPQREVLAKVAKHAFCHCGCPHTLGGCVREHRSCKHAPRMASLAARLAAQNLGAPEVEKILTEYYAGFDRKKRAKLDVAAFGPALGKPDARVAIVEFSDFTCPFCQALRPELERFVADNPGRVRLYFKPFPLSSHERSMEAALAAEWARDAGVFWKMHDGLFEHPHELSDEDLAARAREAGGDPDDLAKALASGKHKDRILASQAEARAAGLQGTPTLYIDGRKLVIPAAPSEVVDVLRFTLDDEEEWAKHGGWSRDG